MQKAVTMVEPGGGQVVQTDAAALMEVISRAAKDPGTDVDKLERLMGLYERINDKRAEQEYSAAMQLAQEQTRPVSQDAANPQTRSKYASYAALDKALRPIYTKNGFSLSFSTGDGAPEGYVRVICKVAHKGGHNEYPHLDLPADGKGAKGNDVMTKTHATMSAVSYGRRGLLKMIFNIAEGDDDGNAAGGGQITDEQVSELGVLITETKSDIRKFCEHMGVSALYEIPAAQFNKAKQALLAKKART